MAIRSDQSIFISSMEAGYIGGGYYNPIEEFEKVARPLKSERIEELCSNSKLSLNAQGDDTYFIANIFSELQSLLLPRELLFAVYDNGKFRVAVYIPAEERLMEFEVQVNSGFLSRSGFFAVDQRKAETGLVNEFRTI